MKIDYREDKFKAKETRREYRRIYRRAIPQEAIYQKIEQEREQGKYSKHSNCIRIFPETTSKAFPNRTNKENRRDEICEMNYARDG